jgi:hypothetical protein
MPGSKFYRLRLETLQRQMRELHPMPYTRALKRLQQQIHEVNRIKTSGAFWEGFLTGFSGPYNLLHPPRRVVSDLDWASTEDAWRAVDGYMRHGLEEEERRVEEASEQAKQVSNTGQPPARSGAY